MNLIRNSCKEKFIKFFGPIFIKTNTENKYLVFSPEPKIGKLISKGSNENLKFINAQILEVNDNAKLYVGNLEITFKARSIKAEESINLDFNFNIPTLNKTILKNVEFVNLGENLEHLENLSLEK